MRDTLTRKHKQLLAGFFIFLLFSGVVAMPIPPDKMKPEEVVAKHLASIGTPDALASVKSRIMVGNSKAFTHSNKINTPVARTGPAQIASEGNKVLLAMIFNSTSYPFEKAGYDGQKLTIGLLESGKRSALGNFLMSYDTIVKQGLIGGALSSAWPLLNLDSKNAKLSYSGTKKINDRQVHELKYMPRNAGGNLQISLFFDAETFRHVRTEYQHVIPARMGITPEESISQLENRYKLVEEFSDFKLEDNLMLPHTYKLRLSIEEQNNTQVFEWEINLSQFVFNQTLDVAAFNVAKSN